MKRRDWNQGKLSPMVAKARAKAELKAQRLSDDDNSWEAWDERVRQIKEMAQRENRAIITPARLM